MKNVLLFFCIITTGVIAGLFFAWSVSVMPGLKKLGDREFISSMQAMNRAIQNPLFFIFFFGALILLVTSCFNFYQKPLTLEYYLLLGSTLLYIIGVMGITIIGNVPLNNMIENFNLTNASDEAMSKIRGTFEEKWTLLNNLRTGSSMAAFCLLIIRLIK